MLTNIHKTKYTINNHSQIKTHKTSKGDHSHLGLTNPKVHLKIDHPHNHNSKYPQLKERGKNVKGEERRIGMIILGQELSAPKPCLTQMMPWGSIDHQLLHVIILLPLISIPIKCKATYKLYLNNPQKSQNHQQQ